MSIQMKVTGFQSGGDYPDGRRRVELRVTTPGQVAFDRLRVPLRDVGVLGLVLDDIVEVSFACPAAAARSRAAGGAGGEA